VYKTGNRRDLGYTHNCRPIVPAKDGRRQDGAVSQSLTSSNTSTIVHRNRDRQTEIETSIRHRSIDRNRDQANDTIEESGFGVRDPELGTRSEPFKTTFRQNLLQGLIRSIRSKFILIH